MHRPDSNCNELTEKTAAAMDNVTLKKLFVTVQRTNLRLTARYAIDDAMSHLTYSAEMIAGYTAAWFDHVW
ncbi:hypothetical protein FRC03_008253, partial [Tulasnella sp. 419]